MSKSLNRAAASTERLTIELSEQERHELLSHVGCCMGLVSRLTVGNKVSGPYTPEQVSAICDALNSLMEGCPRDGEVESWMKMVAPAILRRVMRVEIWWDEAHALYRHL